MQWLELHSVFIARCMVSLPSAAPLWSAYQVLPQLHFRMEVISAKQRIDIRLCSGPVISSLLYQVLTTRWHGAL